MARLPIPADAAIARAEQLLTAASGDPWAEAEILMQSALLYAYAGRFTDARQAVARGGSRFAGSGRRMEWVLAETVAGLIELAAGNPAAAERHLSDVCEALRAMGERGYLSSIAASLAEAVYLQGRLDEAQQLADEAQAAAVAGDVEAQAWWRAIRARLHARRGQFPAARQLANEAIALVSETSYAWFHGHALMAKAEVDRLAGARDQAEASLRAALQIYEERRALPLADQARAALASLTATPAPPHPEAGRHQPEAE